MFVAGGACVSIRYCISIRANTVSTVQWSLYLKTTHGTKKMWSYIAGGLKIKVI